MTNQKLNEFSNGIFLRMAIIFERAAKWARGRVIYEDHNISENIN